MPCTGQKGLSATSESERLLCSSVVKWKFLGIDAKHNVEDLNKNGNIDGISSQAQKLRMLTCQVTSFNLAFSML